MPNETDVETRAHRAAVERLEECFQDEGFDGCIDCIVREVLEAADPILRPQEAEPVEIVCDPKLLDIERFQ